MKVIGTTAKGFLCELDEPELNYIVTGQSSPNEFKAARSVGTEIKISAIFEAVREIETFKTASEYNSVRAMLEKLLAALTPVEGFVEKTKGRITQAKKAQNK